MPMKISNVLFIILLSVALILLYEKYKKRKATQMIEKLDEISGLMEKGEYSGALSILKKIGKTCPPVVYQMMGECYHGLGDEEKAYEFYLKSLSMDMTMDVSHISIAKIEMEKGAYDRAEISLKKAIDIDDNNYMAPYYLAKIYNIWGRYSDAAMLLEKAIDKGLIAREVFILLQDTYVASGNYVDEKRIAERLELLDRRRN
jgi:tetratricopeptide (TPR) repeat protein